ncbi:DUF378 domain-containing protein [Rummeliibacillus sp. TYF-LIM-RU47]|uniref:DUF378 domain-containing protein n=1 Tax=Rummeliibacillus sp. TYF-LIM-RU47 TaxID=2608406 RepID=UPI00123B3CE1|nr:DUF378 domain-containing protein [Rummeliibacillus sp. TYF-LIM-RU47]
MKTILRIALVLTIVGAINWGLIGFFRFDLVASLFGGQLAPISRVVYALVGLSGLACLTLLFMPIGDEAEETMGSGQRNFDYSTEFGEEEDFSRYRDKDDDRDKENKE